MAKAVSKFLCFSFLGLLRRGAPFLFNVQGLMFKVRKVQLFHYYRHFARFE